MLQALLQLLSKQPKLLAEHAQAYGELAAVEWSLLVDDWQARLRFQLLVATGAWMALMLGGVALMLWAALPADSLRWPWMLLAVPLVPLGVAGYGLYALKASQSLRAFPALRGQLQADMALLREVSPS